MTILPGTPNRDRPFGLAAAVLLAALGGCSSETPPITGCEPAAGMTPDCRFANPEDLAPAPGGRFLLVSQFGAMDGSRPGSLVAYDPADGTIEQLFPAASPPSPADAEWGDPACPPPAEFTPHGIDVEQRIDGRHALYAVNHGGRESIEMFEAAADDAGRVRLTWRGCVLAPEQGYFNDVVVLRDGGFWVSQMYPRDANALWTVLRMQLTGYEPGFVYRWTRDGGFQPIPGTETAFANGVEKSADERFLYMNSYFGDAVHKVDVERGRVVASASVASPDNVTWSADGELLVASHHAGLTDVLACQELAEGSCGFRFQIVAVDPETMTARVLLDHAGAPMGAATVALPFGDAVYLGTFAGDRITRVPAAMLTAAASGS